MAIKIEKRGGKREGSGRKALTEQEKRQPLTVYIKQKAVKKYKGEAALKSLIQEQVEAGLI